ALPIVAEDLGLITPDVDALRHAAGFPGMSVLQFAFGSGADNLYLPHNLPRDTVVYSGTHDNDTTIGWYLTADERARDHVRRYLGVSGDEIAWDLIRAAWRSVAETAIVPLQDVLSLGSEARMNVPGRAEGNWGWQMAPDALDPDLAVQLRNLTVLYGRQGTWEDA
ncbi:MAG TPA: 4-alpha-glucanotransferase, partial [Chloroflexi bacterium]|nr:4-alpha-glucanotransferase [Chloroflexota bacterium]